MDEYNGVLIDSLDNVITSLSFIKKDGLIKAIGLTDGLKTNSDIAKGHKVAISKIKNGEIVIKYGKKIGRAKQDINPGDLVHIHNIKSERGKGLRRRKDND